MATPCSHLSGMCRYQLCLTHFLCSLFHVFFFFFSIRVLLKHWFFFMWGFLWNAICLEYDPFLVCKFYFLSVFWCSIHVYGGAFFCQHCSMIFLSMHLFLCNFFYSCEEKLLWSIRSYISFGSQGTKV